MDLATVVADTVVGPVLTVGMDAITRLRPHGLVRSPAFSHVAMVPPGATTIYVANQKRLNLNVAGGSASGISPRATTRDVENRGGVRWRGRGRGTA